MGIKYTMGTTIGIMGGGPSGMMAAIQAARAGSRVILFEKNDRVGKKILATGNGKCNLTNTALEEMCYHSNSSKGLSPYFAQFDQHSTVSFFEDLGMLCKVKNGGVYPYSEQASTVLDILRLECREAGVDVRTQQPVRSIGKDRGIFQIETQTGRERADQVIIACGGKANPKSGSAGDGYGIAEAFGHTVIKPVPSLVQLRCSGEFFKQISGVRTEAEMTLYIENRQVQKERGELMITDYGISGIPVFQFSGAAARALEQRKKTEVVIDFLPRMDRKAFEEFIEKRAVSKCGRTAEEFFLGICHKKLLTLMIKQAGMKLNDVIGTDNGKAWRKVFSLLKGFCVTAVSPNSFDQAQVCSGGVSLEEIDVHMESKLVPGLYFAGEILDVDGRCGGYNLQWAWTSGYIAGRAAADSLG